MTIPIRQVVAVTPGVLTTGGRGIDLVGLLLTTSVRVPIGTVAAFTSATAVANYFGSGSTEKSMADRYFGGYTNSRVKPGRMLMAQYPSAAVAAYLRSAALGMTLAQIQGLTAGTIAVTVSGVLKTSASINLSGASSLSNAAALITAGFTSPGFVVTYDSTADAFVFTNTATGAASTLTFAATSALATSLKLTSAAGAVLSQGADAAVPGTFMDGIKAINRSWAGFATIFNPDVSGNANKLLFAAWVSAQSNQFYYAGWDPDATGTAANPATSSFGYLVESNNYAGVVPIYSPDALHAAFLLGAVDSVDFTQRNGRATMAFRRQEGLVAAVTDETVANNLFGNNYNFYGVYAAAAEDFTWFRQGTISGDFAWIDSYVNQIWMNGKFVSDMAHLLQDVGSIPYNAEGRALIETSIADTVDTALNAGVIRTGIALSESQKAQVNSDAGVQIDDVLSTRGWYLQVLDADADVRVARGSPPATFWYMDGGSVQKIDLASVELQ